MTFLLIVVILSLLFLHNYEDRKRRRKLHLTFTFFTYINFDYMKKQILKSQFVDDGAGNLVVTGAILPVNAKGGNVELAPDTTPQYYSSNESVLQIAAAGPTTFAVKYFGPGTVTLSGTGKSLSGKDVPGYIELIVVDDTEPGGGEDNEAVDLGMSLDVETTDIPE